MPSEQRDEETPRKSEALVGCVLMVITVGLSAVALALALGALYLLVRFIKFAWTN